MKFNRAFIAPSSSAFEAPPPFAAEFSHFREGKQWLFIKEQPCGSTPEQASDCARAVSHRPYQLNNALNAASPLQPRANRVPQEDSFSVLHCYDAGRTPETSRHRLDLPCSE